MPVWPLHVQYGRRSGACPATAQQLHTADFRSHTTSKSKCAGVNHRCCSGQHSCSLKSDASTQTASSPRVAHGHRRAGCRRGAASQHAVRLLSVSALAVTRQSSDPTLFSDSVKAQAGLMSACDGQARTNADQHRCRLRRTILLLTEPCIAASAAARRLQRLASASTCPSVRGDMCLRQNHAQDA